MTASPRVALLATTSFFLLSLTSLRAQTLLQDVQLAPVGGNPDSSITEFVVIGNQAYFAATNQYGRELWVTDGTPSGTRLVIDLYAGTGSSAPENLTVFGNQLVFTADVPGFGREPWITDGTVAGTTLLGDLNPGAAGSTPAHFAA
ncbi:MAG: hypothetical protein KDC98_09010, partial [Planctomycetes bacterium]|nr:hypothetical protein [Planctomycetota bacterium]